MTTRLAILVAMSVLLSVGPAAHAQVAETRYLTPSPDIAKAIAAAELSQTIISPNRKIAALVTLNSVPLIAELAQPMLRLAGMRINPETNNQHFNYRTPTIARLSLISIADGKERPVSLPERGGIQWVQFSPDGTKIALTQASQRGVALLLVDTASGAVRQLTQPVLNRTWGEACDWQHDGRALLCRIVPAGRGQAPHEARVPTGRGCRSTTARQRRSGLARTSSPAPMTMRSSSTTSPASSPSSMRPLAPCRHSVRRACSRACPYRPTANTC
jgi:dipeptidyl aminopeptidase/acylaminoacyl peptidase